MDALYNRADVVESLGLPNWPAASRATVNSHIRAAMCSAERLDERLPLSQRPLNPAKLPRWSASAEKVNQVGNSPLVNAFTMAEAQAMGAPMPFGANAGFGVMDEPASMQAMSQLGMDLMRDLRQTLMSTARAYERDDAWPAAIAKNEDDTHAVVMSVLDVRELPGRVPIMIVAFHRDTEDNIGTSPTLAWITRHLREGGQAKQLTQIRAPLLEQELLLHLLHANAKVLDPSYSPKRHSDEARFKLSFLMPATHSRASVLTEIAINSCAQCGRVENLSTCARCFTTRYCSSDCQRAQFSGHKTTCKAVGASKTVSLRFSFSGASGADRDQYQYQTRVNRHDTAEDIMRAARVADEPIRNRKPPPRPTRRIREPTKVSVAPVPGGPLLLTTTSLHVYVHAQDNNVTEMLAVDRLVRARGSQGRKLFIIGERTGEWEITLFVSEAALPSQAHRW